MEFKENTKLQLTELTENELTEIDGGVMLAAVAWGYLAGLGYSYVTNKFIL